ncbi:MAG TPA: DUF192 domain-containing protein [Phycisphaerae bacterium]|nr:DUF192 domain-containing protein [Phycisphaerae bacterium]
MNTRNNWIGVFRTVVAMTALAVLSSCAADPRPTTPRPTTPRNDFSKMRTATIVITGRTTYTAYVADTEVTREFGLMNVTEAELPADQGMIFVFDQDRLLSFWMHNTIIPLDIAYIRSDGTIVKTHTMQPLDERGYPSIEPARFALEVRAGQFAQWGIRAGDHVELPAELLN